MIRHSVTFCCQDTLSHPRHWASANYVVWLFNKLEQTFDKSLKATDTFLSSCITLSDALSTRTGINPLTKDLFVRSCSSGKLYGKYFSCTQTIEYCGTGHEYTPHCIDLYLLYI